MILELALSERLLLLSIFLSFIAMVLSFFC
jgi:hypothetical protein